MDNKLLRRDTLDRDMYYIATHEIKKSMGRIGVADIKRYKDRLRMVVDSLIHACDVKRDEGKI